MAEWKRLIEEIDGIAIKTNLSDLSLPEDYERLVSEFVSLSTRQDIASSPILLNAVKYGSSALISLKLSPENRFKENLLSFLCSTLKAVLICLDRGQDPSEFIDTIEERIKEILSPSAAKIVKTFFDLHPNEISGYVISACSLLDESEENIMSLEKTPQDKDLIDGVFRNFHTLKGEANLTGLSSIALLSSEAENFLSAMRCKTIKMDAELSTLILKVIDRLRELLDIVTHDPSKAAACDIGAFVAELREVFAKKNQDAALAFSSQAPQLDLSGGTEILIGFIVEANEQLSIAEKSVLALESSPDNTEAINSIFRSFHTIKGAARFLDLKDIQIYAHESETMLDMVRKGSLRFEGRIVELALSSIDGLSMLLAHLQEQVSNGGKILSNYPDISPRIAALREISGPKKSQPIGEILVKQGVITNGELKEALIIQKDIKPDVKIGDILVANKAASTKQIEDALLNQKSNVFVGASIRIQLEKLDSLMDLVGELVISESLVLQNPQITVVKEQQFQRNLVELDRITRNLQQVVMGMRLIQIGPTFLKMERLVRDLSKSIGKEVTVTLSGEDTEIDKNMAELIVDPLMHMIRNSLDHGIEFKEERLARGKALVGKIELSAYHKGGFVVLEVKDDGRGLNRDKILRKGIEQGLVKMDEKLSDSRIFNLIFEPGFSTADKVTEVSGRGVGMDVVKKNVDRLHGKINISSEEGMGSVFTILFPITLAIVDGIVVRVSDERYVLPINSVIEFIQPRESDRTLVYGKEEMYKVYDKVYPLVHLKDVFNVAGVPANFEDLTICILESDYGRACVVVDELLGQQQVVIKNLGGKLMNIPGISGAAILGDGRVGLILDASSLIEFAVKQGVA